MIGLNSRLLRLLALVLALIVLGAACGGDDDDAAGEQTDQGATETTVAPVATGPDTPAAQVRASLEGLLQEHVVLAAAATGAAVDGRNDEFTAAAGALEANSDALTATMGAVFGEEAGTAFDPLWKKHIGFFVDYAQGLATGDGGKSQRAVAALTAYTEEFGAFVNSLLPDLPAATVADLLETHITSLKAVVDAYSQKDYTAAYTGLRTATAHMGTIAEPLSAAMAAQFPDKVSGDPKSEESTLATTLNAALQEHVFLASAATGAALGGRQDEFMAAAAALEANSNAITAIIGNVYGAEAGRAFDPLWKKHIGFLVDYTTGVAGKDNAKKDKATNDLLAYTDDFGAFINRLSPELPKATVAELLKTHVLTLIDVVDAHGNKDFTKAYAAERTAAGHMKMISDPLTATIVAQFPDKF